MRGVARLEYQTIHGKVAGLSSIIIATQEQADWLVAVEMFALIDGPKNEPGRPELGRATACKAATAQENVAMEHL